MSVCMDIRSELDGSLDTSLNCLANMSLRLWTTRFANYNFKYISKIVCWQSHVSALKISLIRKQNRALKKKIFYKKIISYIIKTNKINFIGIHTRVIEQNLTKQWALPTEQPGTLTIA